MSATLRKDEELAAIALISYDVKMMKLAKPILLSMLPEGTRITYQPPNTKRQGITSELS
jgi:hypothetical protein